VLTNTFASACSGPGAYRVETPQAYFTALQQPFTPLPGWAGALAL